MIQLNNLHYTISGNSILNGVSMHFESGKFYSILGPNGCGKSTIIRAITKEIQVDGEIVVFSKLRQSIEQRFFSSNVAIMNQMNTIEESVTVEELVSYGRSVNKRLFESFKKEDYQIIEDTLTFTDLISLRNRRMGSLSGGEKQRVFLATCLAMKPKVLILDEPTNHLDIRYQYELLQLVKRLNIEEQVTIICVLHDLNQALKYSDYLYLLKKGTIHYEGKPNDIMTKEVIKDIYEIDSIVHRDGNGLHVDFVV